MSHLGAARLLGGKMGTGSVLAAVAWAASAMQPTLALAQEGRAEVREGNRLYAEGHYDDAHKKYLDALRAAPNSPLIRFNDGNALYQSQEFQRALGEYREAIESGNPDLEARAWYNLGNALYRQQQFSDALDAYKQALRRTPNDMDAKHNLELVLEKLQQQQQQQQNQQQQQQNQSEDQQQQQRDEQQEQQQQPQEQQPQEQQSEGGDQREDQSRDEGGGQTQRDEEQAGREEQQQPQPGEMSREQAERLLQAIREDPDKIARKRVPAGKRRKPKKDW